MLQRLCYVTVLGDFIVSSFSHQGLYTLLYIVLYEVLFDKFNAEDRAGQVDDIIMCYSESGSSCRRCSSLMSVLLLTVGGRQMLQ